MIPKLSILIATLESRRPAFDRLCTELNRQITEDVEVLFSRDRGQVSVGAKRQSLIEQATGDFVCFIDDDDTIHPNYVGLILPHCVEGVDCIGFKVMVHGIAGRKNEAACVSNRYRKWEENKDGFRYVRPPHHLVPIRRQHALRAGFTDKRHGEDSDYSMKLQRMGILKNERFIDEFMYTYWFNGNKRPGQ